MNRFAWMAALLLPVASLAAEPTPLAPGVAFIPGGFEPGSQPDGNTIVWTGEDGLVVFDTGRHAAHTQAILDFAEAAKLPVTAIVNSHWHLDHVGGNPMVRAKFPDARVYASDGMEHALTRFLAKYATQLQGRIDDPETPAADRDAYRIELGLLAKPELLKPTDVVAEAGTKELSGIELQLNLEPHAATSSDLWVLDPRSGILASGDLVTLPAPFLDTACPDGWRKSLDRLAEVEFKTLVPGHGEPMDKPGFLRYRTAYDHLLDCAAAGKGTDACTDGWLADTRGFVPSTDAQLTRDLLKFYLEHNLKPGNTERYCSE